MQILKMFHSFENKNWYTIFRITAARMGNVCQILNARKCAADVETIVFCFALLFCIFFL